MTAIATMLNIGYDRSGIYGAHLMPPNGEGVNLVMLDALDLSKCLTDPALPDSKTAVSAYEDRMISPAAALTEEPMADIEDFAAPTEESVQS